MNEVSLKFLLHSVIQFNLNRAIIILNFLMLLVINFLLEVIYIFLKLGAK